MSLNRLLLVGALLLTPSLTGCSKVGRTDVETGGRVNTGRARFDNYFREVQRFKKRVEKLERDDLFVLREPLIEELDVDADVALGPLMTATRERVKKFRGYGVMLSLHIAPDAELQVVRGDVEIDQKDERLIKAIETAAKSAMTSFSDYTELLEEMSALEVQRAELADRIDSLPKKFEARKGMIEDEIVGAGRVLRGSERTLLSKTQVISHFLVGLSSAIESGASTANVEACEEAIAFKKEQEDKKTPWWKKKRRPRPRWRPPPGGARPAPKPRPAPAGGGGDFEM